jgi:hypothetical protein
MQHATEALPPRTLQRKGKRVGDWMGLSLLILLGCRSSR